MTTPSGKSRGASKGEGARARASSVSSQETDEAGGQGASKMRKPTKSAPKSRSKSKAQPKTQTKSKPKAKSKARPKTKAPANKDAQPGLFVVGIGASAGGLEALRPLVGKLPALSNMAYVVVQHLSPQYRSMLAQILGRDTELSIEEITDDTPVRRNVVYVTPPDKDVVIHNGRLHLHKPSAPVGPKPSVDAFLVSLAEDRGEYAIGVILSGTGSDGAHGMRAIKAHSGYTIVQDPETTKYDGMPKAAIQTGCVDRQMPPEQIGQELTSIAQFPRTIAQKSAESAEHDTLDEILNALRRRTDVDFSQYKHNTLCRRLERRMAANRLETMDKYLGFIRKQPQELDYLCKDILISVTSFFRDGKAFEALGRSFTDILREKKPGDNIRIWIPGCATGEEAYSIAMMLCDHLGKVINDYTVQLFATDLDMDAMAHARKGVYSEQTVKGLDPDYINKYFNAMGQSYQVKKSIREMVVFARQDLTKDPPFVRVDLISCRNVLIYFNAELQERLMGVFHYALNNGGYLFLGRSESIGHHNDLFKPVLKSERVFIKRNTYDVKSTNLFGTFKPRLTPEREAHVAEQQPKSVVELMSEAFVDAYAPDSVVVNDNLDVLHFHENVETFIRLPKGTPNLNLSKLIIEEFRSDLRVLLHRVRKENGAVFGQKKRLELKNGPVLARLAVRELKAQPRMDAYGGNESLYLVSCETFDVPEPLAASLTLDADGFEISEETEQRIAELEHELAATKENLQTVVEELETSNEELQALNEELQASNEELQSSNEELETSNEELQSTNEELTTVNEEVNVRSMELNELNTDLENIQENIGFPLLVVDNDLHVTRYSPYAVRLFDLMDADIGQVITSIPTYTDLRNLRANLQSVIATGSTFEEEVRADEIIYRMRIVPYRDYDGQVGGAILTFIDETKERLAHEQVIEQQDWIRMVTDSVPVLIYYIDNDGRFRFANQPCAEFYGYSVKDLNGMQLQKAVGVKNYNQMKPQLDDVWKGNSQMFEYRGKSAAGKARDLQVRLQPDIDGAGNIRGYFAIQTDVSELKQIEADLIKAKEVAEYANQAKSNFLASMSHELRTPLNAIMAFSEMIRLEKFGEHASPKYREYAHDIYSSGQHLTNMISEILDLSKVEAKMVELDEKTLDVSDAIESSVRIVREKAYERGVELSCNMPDDLPPLLADETMIKRICINLISNAVKFTPEGGQVQVSADFDGATMNVTVHDTGIGIPPQDLERILQPFEQVKNHLQSDEREGVGLGLSITKSLVEMHQGELDIASDLGKGTTVTVSFPRERVDAARVAS